MSEVETLSPLGRVDRAGRTRTSGGGELHIQLAALARMTHGELQAEWQRLYRSRPPKKVGRDLLELGIAWKLQEKALGGFDATTRRQLAGLVQTMSAGGDLSMPRTAKLKPGARLLREWNGETHEVLVLEDGFRWRGQYWRSLSAIAREITGARWSGPRFFGMQPRDNAAPSSGGGREGSRSLQEMVDA